MLFMLGKKGVIAWVVMFVHGMLCPSYRSSALTASSTEPNELALATLAAKYQDLKEPLVR